MDAPTRNGRNALKLGPVPRLEAAATIAAAVVVRLAIRLRRRTPEGPKAPRRLLH